MSSLWCPGAKVAVASKDGGSLLGGSAKVVWHTTENDATQTSATNVAAFLNRVGSQVHIVWNPVTGELVQCIPANRAGRGLMNKKGGVETNRAGSVVIQIEVVGRASQPFTDTAMKNLSVIMAWLDSLGIARAWPAGESKGAGHAYNRSTAAWAASGHFGHQNVPENTHWDSGAIDRDKINGLVVKPKPAVVKTPIKAATGRDIAKSKAVQVAVHVPNDGKFGPGSAKAVYAVVHKSLGDVRYLQTRVGAKADGSWGPNSEAARINAIKGVQRAIGVVADGLWGTGTQAAWNVFYAGNFNKF